MLRIAKEVEDSIIGQPTNIATELVESELDRLADSGEAGWLASWRNEVGVLRTRRLTVAWIKTYIAATCEELESFIENPEKSYEVYKENHGNDLLKFSFRLKTSGLDGYTQFGISVRRRGEYFDCIE
jgi:hypothetical protein